MDKDYALTLDCDLSIEPMTLDVDMGTVYDVTGDEYERGYVAGKQAGYATGRQEGYSEGEAAGYESGQADEQTVTGSIIDRSISGAYVNERVTSIGTQAFRECRSLTGVKLPAVETINSAAFNTCAALSDVELPVCKTIAASAFQYCAGLTSLSLPECRTFANSAFYGCSQLASVVLGAATTIGANVFQNCTSLTALVIRLEGNVCALSYSSALGGTPIASGAGYIYVPDDLVDSYKAATNWSTYAAQIRPLSDWEG